MITFNLILFSKGRYEQAVEYFNKSYNIARAMNDTESISSSRVLFGVAAAHKMLQAVTLHVDLGTRPCIERMLEWKDNRGDEFDKPLPESGTMKSSYLYQYLREANTLHLCLFTNL